MIILCCLLFILYIYLQNYPSASYAEEPTPNKYIVFSFSFVSPRSLSETSCLASGLIFK